MAYAWDGDGRVLENEVERDALGGGNLGVLGVQFKLADGILCESMDASY